MSKRDNVVNKIYKRGEINKFNETFQRAVRKKTHYRRIMKNVLAAIGHYHRTENRRRVKIKHPRWKNAI